MKILVAVASKHGSTRGIADAIGETLQQAGHAVDVRNAQDAPSVDGYDAVVAGSAIYMGNWMSEAKAFLQQNEGRFAGSRSGCLAAVRLATTIPKAWACPRTSTT